MRELLLRRKAKFIQYLFATFLFIIDHFAQMGIFALILGAIQKGDVKYYKTVVIITAVFIIYTPLNFLLSRMLRIRYMRDTILDVRKQAFDKIINLSFKQFSQKSKEIYISNLINDVNTFENKFFISLLNYLINMGMYLFSLLFLILLDLKLAAGMFLFSLVLFLLAHMFTKKMTALEQSVSEYNERFTTDMSNTFNGIEILKLNNIEDKFLAKSLVTINRAEQKKYAANVFNELQRNVIRILGFVVSVVVMIYLAYEFQEGLSLAKAGLTFQLCSSISNFLISAFPMRNQVRASLSIYEKIAKSESYAENRHNSNKSFDFKDQIQVNGVNFSYEKKPILQNASFTIEKGKKYLIKGVSGAGKSTLMNLLAMANDDYEGTISVDRVDYREIEEKSFHNKVAFIYQDVFLFEDTIRNNITLYKDIPEEQIQYAIKVCGLTTMIEERGGIDERITENGKNLSGGQRQRISIARAIAKNAEILFVDEGTSSLNVELGREIERVFLSLNNTVIAISHRFYEGVTDRYDYVIELKNGLVNRYPAKEYFDEVITW
ncbi:ATP-binding cassette domain-containing protein [Anaerocolumna sp. MB42-C2]|uniref:ATP-binding cassette domain-containing protein n=1 Tax=Anaerocolumna sp. MB42-C2 TaxID=3070997 RepID=UPI0027E00744|nr:ABC transporter ATP-binding protein [Anaerocolumna sp. MB42-C2]WMJ86706.1 ABC transporter ATP-binding protein [Anaerocolumna sp. MB42-C2]